MGETLSPSTTNDMDTKKKDIKDKTKTKSDKTQTKGDPQKSQVLAYIIWFFGGIFGLHHVYLHRDFHAFVHWSTFAGYFGIGWIIDFFKIPAFVRDFNEDPRFVKEFVEKLKKNQRPPFSTYRFMAAICTGYLWGNIGMIAIPEDEKFGAIVSYLHWFIPLLIALGKNRFSFSCMIISF